MKFKREWTYLAKKDGRWYIIHQAGDRSWNAMVFTHTTNNDKTSILHGNATSLRNEFLMVYAFDTDSAMRQGMFSILKTGTLNGSE